MYKRKTSEANFRFSPEKNATYSIDFFDENVEINTKEFNINIDKSTFGMPFFWRDLFIISNPNSRKTSIYKNDSLIKEISGFIRSSNQDYLILTKKEGGNRSLNILNKKFELEKTFENGWAQWFINSDVFIFSEYHNLEIVKIYNFNTKTIIEISIPLKDWNSLDGEKNRNRIYQTIGQWKNELLISLGRFVLVSFDIETGKELWRIDDFIQEVSSNPIIESKRRGSIKWLLSEVENKAYLLVLNCLFELDLNQKKTQLIKNYNESGEQQWYFSNSRLYDEYITFSGANQLGKFPMVAGIIDRNTKDILWSTKCEPGIYFEEAPQIKEGKLYVLDSSKTLHIFEQ